MLGEMEADLIPEETLLQYFARMNVPSRVMDMGDAIFANDYAAVASDVGMPSPLQSLHNQRLCISLWVWAVGILLRVHLHHTRWCRGWLRPSDDPTFELNQMTNPLWSSDSSFQSAFKAQYSSPSDASLVLVERRHTRDCA